MCSQRQHSLCPLAHSVGSVCLHVSKATVYAADTQHSTCGLQVLDAVLGKIQDQCHYLIDASMTAQSGLQAFDFLGGSILAAVDQQVAETLPGERMYANCTEKTWLVLQLG